VADPDLTSLARITPAHFGSVSSLTAVPLSDGTTLLASAGDDNAIRVWDPTTGASVNKLAVEDTPTIRAMAAIRLLNATLLAIGADDGTIKLLDAWTGVRIDRITAHEGSVTALLPFPLPGRHRGHGLASPRRRPPR
jgi:WD40 repeat protein